MSKPMQVKALYDCVGDTEDELSFRAGDVISEVSPADDPEWYYGSLNGKRGLLPGNYVEILIEPSIVVGPQAARSISVSGSPSLPRAHTIGVRRDFTTGSIPDTKKGESGHLDTLARAKRKTAAFDTRQALMEKSTLLAKAGRGTAPNGQANGPIGSANTHADANTALAETMKRSLSTSSMGSAVSNDSCNSVSSSVSALRNKFQGLSTDEGPVGGKPSIGKRPPLLLSNQSNAPPVIPARAEPKVVDAEPKSFIPQRKLSLPLDRAQEVPPPPPSRPSIAPKTPIQSYTAPSLPSRPARDTPPPPPARPAAHPPLPSRPAPQAVMPPGAQMATADPPVPIPPRPAPRPPVAKEETNEKGNVSGGGPFASMMGGAKSLMSRSMTVGANKTSEPASKEKAKNTLAPPSPVAIVRYVSLFRETLPPGRTHLNGSEARAVWVKSGLNSLTLGIIWKLADMDGDNQLDCKEFCVGMHLIDERLRGAELPSVSQCMSMAKLMGAI